MKEQIMMVHNIGISLIVFLFWFSISCKSQVSRDSIELTRLKKKMVYYTQDSISVKLTYMAYACGDCIPQYRIDSVFFSDASPASFYLNKEISVKYLKKELEAKVDNIKCAWGCYSFYLMGRFKRNSLGLMMLEVIDGRIIEKRDCCKR